MDVPTAILIDLDGVLVDTETAKTDSYFSALTDRFYPYFPQLRSIDRRTFDHYRIKGVSRRAVCEHLMEQFTLRHICECRLLAILADMKHVGGQSVQVWKDLLMHHNPKNAPAPWKAIAFDRMIKYLGMREKVRKCPGARAFVELARKNVQTVGLVTLSTNAEAIYLLGKAQIPTDHFKLFVTNDLVHCSATKTAHYLEAFKMLHWNHNPSDALVIEDSDAGVDAARQAGFGRVQKVAIRGAQAVEGVQTLTSLAKNMGWLPSHVKTN